MNHALQFITVTATHRKKKNTKKTEQICSPAINRDVINRKQSSSNSNSMQENPTRYFARY